jgi:hypothetical protein
MKEELTKAIESFLLELSSQVLTLHILKQM